MRMRNHTSSQPRGRVPIRAEKAQAYTQPADLGSTVTSMA